MSLKGSKTTSDYLEYDESIRLINELKNDGEYLMSLFILISINTGLKVSDILKLTWNDFKTKYIISNDEILILNENVINYGLYVKEKLNIEKNDFIFKSKKNRIFSIQRINVLLKNYKIIYNVKCDNFSTHSLRKTFGRKVFFNAEKHEKMDVLNALNKFLGQTDILDTINYLALDKNDIFENKKIDIGEIFNRNISLIEINDKNKKEKPSYCYLMKDDSMENCYKIGKSDNPYFREKTLMCEKPTISLFLITKFNSSKEAYIEENRMHNFFSDKHIRGEWYNLDSTDISFLKKEYQWEEKKIF